MLTHGILTCPAPPYPSAGLNAACVSALIADDQVITYLPSITVTHFAKQAGLLKPCRAMKFAFCNDALLGAQESAAALNVYTAWQGVKGARSRRNQTDEHLKSKKSHQNKSYTCIL